MSDPTKADCPVCATKAAGLPTPGYTHTCGRADAYTVEDMLKAREWLDYFWESDQVPVESLAAFRAEARREAEELAQMWEQRERMKTVELTKVRQSEREACERIVEEYAWPEAVKDDLLRRLRKSS